MSSILGKHFLHFSKISCIFPVHLQIDSGSSGGGIGQSAPLIPVTTDASEMELSYEMSPSEMLVNITGTTTSLDDFYPSVAIATLMKIIRDPTQVWPLNSFFLCLLFFAKNH